MIKFIHCGDIHLGNSQYDIPERMLDFERAFAGVLDFAIEKAVDFVLVTGDLFDKRNINAATLAQALPLLERLRQKGTPLVAVEGNHDKDYFQDHKSWLNLGTYGS